MKNRTECGQAVRLIPRLDIKGPNVVKGIHLEGLRVIGRPDEMARCYFEEGADELFFMDVVASLYGRNSLEETISRTASEIFVPLTVGGGLRSIKDISNVLHAGADKVCINTAAIRDPRIIYEASRNFGSSTIVVAIEAIKNQNGTWTAYTDNGREPSEKNVVKWAQQAVDLGAGEIVITSVDREGTGEGFDLDLIKNVTRAVTVPVIAHGGAGGPSDVAMAVLESGVDAVAVASILHYHFIKNHSTGAATKTEGNIEFLKQKRGFHTLQTASVAGIKQVMHDNDISVRL